jgi:hypothetical protein
MPQAISANCYFEKSDLTGYSNLQASLLASLGCLQVNAISEPVLAKVEEEPVCHA